MGNAINMTGLSRVSSSLLKDRQERQAAQSSSFFAMAEQIKNGAEVLSAARNNVIIPKGAAAAEDMTMEEYKAFISDKISQLPVHPSRVFDSISIRISDAGFEAMKNDPEYAEWVLNQLQDDFARENPGAIFSGGSYSVKYIGATKKEYRSESWPKSSQNGEELFEEKSADSFWKRRTESHREFQKLQKEAAIKRWYLQRRLNGDPIGAAELLGCI